MLSDLSVLYLFLGGSGAGLCLVASIVSLLVPRSEISLPQAVGARASALRLGHLGRLCLRQRSGLEKAVLFVDLRDPYRSLFLPSYLVAAAVLAVGCVCLLCDLGAPARILLILTNPQPTFITFGTVVLGGSLALSAVLALMWAGAGRWRLGVARTVAVVAAAFSASTMGYTGLLLQSLAAVPLWASPWIPVLFFASAVSCGIGLMLGTACLAGAQEAFDRLMRRLAVFDAAAAVVEAVAASALVVAVCATAGSSVADVLSPVAPVAPVEPQSIDSPSASSASVTNPSADGDVPPDVADVSSETATDRAAVRSVRALLAGNVAPVFWGGFACLGVALPLVLDAVMAAKRRACPALAPIAQMTCVLCGALAMRWSVVQAGMHPVFAGAGAA